MKRRPRGSTSAVLASFEMAGPYLVALEGGGTRSQAAVMDWASGRILALRESGSVNANFISLAEAQQAALSAVCGVLDAAQAQGEAVRVFASALVGARFGAEVFASLLPRASYHFYGEGDVVFARAAVYPPHGVAVVGATGATTWAVRADQGRELIFGGWGALLGDEGSAYAMGLAGLRAAARAFEGREGPTRLVDAVCQQFNISPTTFREDLIALAYHKPLTRAEIAGLAVTVTRLAAEGDTVARQIVDIVAGDLMALVLHAARSSFGAQESFPVAAAGGLFNAGEMILGPLRSGLAREFPNARLILGKEAPAAALARLALDDFIHHRRDYVD